MYMSPTFFFDAGLRSLMRNPFFNPTRPILLEGESDFRLLDGREGLVVTLAPNASIFDRPGRSVCRWPGMKTLPRQNPHPPPRQSRLMRELSIFLHMLCGGGDVLLNRITTQGEQRDILLTAGEGNVVEKVDLAELARDGAPPLLFLQPAYLCSSANVVIQSVPCDASVMSWARAFYVYVAGFPREFGASAILSSPDGQSLVRAIGAGRESGLRSRQCRRGDGQCRPPPCGRRANVIPERHCKCRRS